MKKLEEIRPYFSGAFRLRSGYYEQLADGGRICLAVGYSGDAMIAPPHGEEGNSEDPDRLCLPPRLRCRVYVDSMVIPAADSPNASPAP